MLSAVKSLKDSAQSPAWSRKASPATCASDRRRCGLPRRKRAAAASTAPSGPGRGHGRRASPAAASAARARQDALRVRGPWQAVGSRLSAMAPGRIRAARAQSRAPEAPAWAGCVGAYVCATWVHADRDLRGHVRPHPRRTSRGRRQRQGRPRPRPGHHDGRQHPVAEGRGRAVTPAEERYDLVRAAVGDVPGLEAGRNEIDRGGDPTRPTPCRRCPPVPRGRVVRDRGLGRQRRGTDLGTLGRGPRLARLVVVNRPGTPAARRPAPAGLALWPRSPCPTWRSRAQTCGRGRPTGRPLDYLVPEAAVRVIRERNLYSRRRMTTALGAHPGASRRDQPAACQAWVGPAPAQPGEGLGGTCAAHRPRGDSGLAGVAMARQPERASSAPISREPNAHQ